MVSQLREKQQHPQEPYSARKAFAGLLQRIESGQHNPYSTRLTEDMKRNTLKNLIDSRGIRYATCTLENFQVACKEQQLAVNTVRSYLSRLDKHLIATNGGGLIFIGPAGTGKDHLMMAAMVVAILEFGLSVVWSDGIRMYHTLKNAISKNATEQEIARFVKPQILAISDPLPPKDELSTYEMACLRDIIDQRYSRGLATWVTTNVQSEQEAKQKLTGPILSRIGHNATEINCSWAGHRKPLTRTT